MTAGERMPTSVGDFIQEPLPSTSRAAELQVTVISFRSQFWALAHSRKHPAIVTWILTLALNAVLLCRPQAPVALFRCAWSHILYRRKHLEKSPQKYKQG